MNKWYLSVINDEFQMTRPVKQAIEVRSLYWWEKIIYWKKILTKKMCYRTDGKREI